MPEEQQRAGLPVHDEPNDYRKEKRERDEQGTSEKSREMLILVGILQHKDTRTYLYHLLTRAGIFDGSHVPGDSHTTAYNDGKKHFGRMLLRDIEAADPKAYQRMKFESLTERKQRKGKDHE